MTETVIACRGVGSRLVDQVKKGAESRPGMAVAALVHEREVCAHLFLRAGETCRPVNMYPSA